MIESKAEREAFSSAVVKVLDATEALGRTVVKGESHLILRAAYTTLQSALVDLEIAGLSILSPAIQIRLLAAEEEH